MREGKCGGWGKNRKKRKKKTPKYFSQPEKRSFLTGFPPFLPFLLELPIMGCVSGKGKTPAPPPKDNTPKVESGTSQAATTSAGKSGGDSDMQGVSTQPIAEVYDIVREIGTYVIFSLFFSFFFFLQLISSSTKTTNTSFFFSLIFFFFFFFIFFFSFLFRGGFSVVHEAIQRTTGDKFAVKIIKKQAIEGEDIKLLKREIQIMKQLDHPNILKLFEVYEDANSFYLVMELVQGKELFDKIVERGQYSEKDAAHIIRQILSAVSYLHSHDIAHRDLKPENLLSAGSGDHEVIKIADFGFSKNFGEEKLMTSCGSPGYVAPEVLTSE